MSTDNSDNSVDLDRLANSPKRVTTDEGTVEERSADDAMKLDGYQKGAKAKGPPYGMRIGQIIHRGTV